MSTMKNDIDEACSTTITGDGIWLPKWLFCLILSTVPIGISLLGFSTEFGFLALPRFGGIFRAQALEPVKEFAPPTKPDDIGYDGQFYAQIALDPTLRNPELKNACDNISYRAKRIFLPSLAFVLGAGRPWVVLQIYSVLNVLFWFLLMVVLLRQFGIDTWRNQLLVIGILWNAGCLISIGRALTDLPALCLGIMAVCLQTNRTNKQFENSPLNRNAWLLASVVSSLSVLTKETAMLSFFSFCNGSIRRRWWHIIVTAGIVLIPISLWMVYVRNQVGNDVTGLGNFSMPFYGFFHKLYVEWKKAILEFPRLPLLEMIAPWTIVVQIVFMLRHTSWRSKWWQFGIGFVLLAMMISPWVWATQSAYSRCLLPLGVSFNVLLSQLRMSRSTHWKWWVLGNLGFLDRAAIGILLLLIAEVSWRRFESRSSQNNQALPAIRPPS